MLLPAVDSAPAFRETCNASADRVGVLGYPCFCREIGLTWPCAGCLNSYNPKRSCWWGQPAAWQSEAGWDGSGPGLARWDSCSSGPGCEHCLLKVDGSRANEEGQVYISLAVNCAGEAVKIVLALLRDTSRSELSPAVVTCWLRCVSWAGGGCAEHQCQCWGL